MIVIITHIFHVQFIPNFVARQIIFLNETFVDYEDFSNVAMPMYNLIEYSDSYSDTSGSLCVKKEMR